MSCTVGTCQQSMPHTSKMAHPPKSPSWMKEPHPQMLPHRARPLSSTRRGSVQHHLQPDSPPSTPRAKLSPNLFCERETGYAFVHELTFVLSLEARLSFYWRLSARYQENLVVLCKMSQLLDCRPSQFSVSGTKDKIAVTTQEVTIKGVTAHRSGKCLNHMTVTRLSRDYDDCMCRLAKVREALSQHDIEIGNFEYVKAPLLLGGHSGNHFQMLLRSLQPKGEGQWADLEGVVTSSLEAVGQRGFVNYFGLQRVGRRLSMPRIGLHILRNNLASWPLKA